MEIKYSDDVILKINITDQMVADWKEHYRLAHIPGDGKDCSTCSLNITIDDECAICEISEVIKELDRLAGIEDEEVKEHLENGRSIPVEEQSIERCREILKILGAICLAIFLALIIFGGINPPKTSILTDLAIPFALAAVFCLGLSG